MAGQMSGKVVVMTGGSSGIGRAAALAFAKEGAQVAVANRTRTTGEEVVRIIQESGGEALWIQTDVSKVSQVESLINAVCPGWIKTPPVEGMLQDNPDAAKGMLMHQPIGRFGEPEEVAQAVVWLCSDAASFVLGTALGVDGGYLAV